VYDAIEVAGGATTQVDLTKVNLAYILSDGEKIYIPSVNDEDCESENTSTQTGSTKVNINTATQEQLEVLNGIGESLAQSIVDYRNKNGKFSAIEDIKNVSGIGDSKFEKIKDYICVK
jgi:competence protein ComEA